MNSKIHIIQPSVTISNFLRGKKITLLQETSSSPSKEDESKKSGHESAEMTNWAKKEEEGVKQLMQS